MRIDNILVATDLSDESGAAAKCAEQLRKITTGRVTVTHVIEASLSTWLTSAFEMLEDDDKRAAAEETLATWYEKHTGSRPDGVRLVAGNCFVQVTEGVRAMDGNTVLVVSKTGKSTIRKILLGSTTHALASQPPCPLFIVHPDTPETSGPVTTGTDLSYNGNRAVSFALGLAKFYGTSVEVLHADTPPQSPLMSVGADNMRESRNRLVTRELQRIPGLPAPNAKFEVVFDDPADAIIDRSLESGADLIVLGHSGESPLIQTVLGSVTQRVLNHTPCTLVIVPAEMPSSDEEE